MYGEWIVWRETPLFAQQDRHSKIVAVLQPYQVVEALTGEYWITKPGRVTVTKDYGRYRKDEVVYLYTYQGEGEYKVWHRGQMFLEWILFAFPENYLPCRVGAPESWGRYDATPQGVLWGSDQNWRGSGRMDNGAAHFGNTHHCGEDSIQAQPIIECLKLGMSPRECSVP